MMLAIVRSISLWSIFHNDVENGGVCPFPKALLIVDNTYDLHANFIECKLQFSDMMIYYNTHFKITIIYPTLSVDYVASC